VCVEDFLKRFSRRERTDAENLRAARWLTLMWGVLITAMALAFQDIPSAQVMWPKVISVSTNGILGLLGLALWPGRLHRWSARAGFIASYVVLFSLMCWTDVDDLLWPIFGNATCFVVGLLVAYSSPRDITHSAGD
jgi:Na+/proline symporter